MGKVPARISVRMGDKVTRVSSSRRNPRGIHYRSGEVSVKVAGLTKADRVGAIAAAVLALFEEQSA